MYVIEYGELDEDGDVIQTYDRDLFCNALCASQHSNHYHPDEDRDDIVNEGETYGGGYESGTNVYCPTCGAMLEHGLQQSADFDCTDDHCPQCPPLVVNLVAPYEHDERCDNCGCVQYQGRS